MHVMSGALPDGKDQTSGQPPGRLPVVPGQQTPPPAPPPPPPPPPLMPPLLPGLGAPELGQKKRRVRSFFWKTIPEDQVKGGTNLWNQGGVRQGYQIDVGTVEELFGQIAEPLPGCGTRTRTSFREHKEELSILDSKRGMNVGIFLKQFKRDSQTVIDELRRGNSRALGAEPLRELLKLLPESEEVTKLRAFTGEVDKLPLADSFMHSLVLLPSYRVRLESLLLKEDFPTAVENMDRDMRTLRAAAREVLSCQELHAVLHLVLQAGNILNAGGSAGEALGFKLSSLLSLADTKANKPGMNLLHFVALEAEKKDRKLLEFPVKLCHIQAASRVSMETLDAELQCLTSRTRTVEENVRRDTELLQQLEDFLQSCASSLLALASGRQRLQADASELLDFFCEDRESRLDQCLSTVHTFCLRFRQAVKENEEREVKEATRRRRLQRLEEQKRHSWAGGEEVGGAFTLCRGGEAEDAVMLVELLAMKPRPRSPLSLSGSSWRVRNSPRSAATGWEPMAAIPKVGLRTSDWKNFEAGLSVDEAFPVNDSERTTPNGDSVDSCCVASPRPEETGSGAISHGDEALVHMENRPLVPEQTAPETDVGVQDMASQRGGTGPSEERRPAESSTGQEGQSQLVWCVTGVCEADAPARTETGRCLDGSASRDQTSSCRTSSEMVDEMPANIPISSQPLPADDGKKRLTCNKTTSSQPSGVTSKNTLSTTAAVQKSKAVRTLTSSETQGLRRVVSISRNSRAANSTIRPSDKSPASTRMSSASTRTSSASTRTSSASTRTSSASTRTSSPSIRMSFTSTRSSSPTTLMSPASAHTSPASTRTSSASTRTSFTSTRSSSSTTLMSPSSAYTSPASTLMSACTLTSPGASTHRGDGLDNTLLSRRYGVRKMAALGGSQTETVSGSSVFPAGKKRNPQRKASPRKMTPSETRAAPEEKICRSTLRTLSRTGGGSVSTPVTPLHRVSSSSSSLPAALLPGFARSTASSSFRSTASSSFRSLASSSSPLRKAT